MRISKPGVPVFEMDYGPELNNYFAQTGTAPDTEPFETQIFSTLISERPRILDIGANRGWYTCIAGAIAGSRASIMAFEPDKENFDLLVTNVSKNHFHFVHSHRIPLGAKTKLASCI